jgi:hypothetical protein
MSTPLLAPLDAPQVRGQTQKYQRLTVRRGPILEATALKLIVQNRAQP